MTHTPPNNDGTAQSEPTDGDCPHPLADITWDDEITGDEILTQDGTCTACGAGVELVFQCIGVRLKDASAGAFVHIN